MKGFSKIILLFFLVSCGDLLQEGVDKIADQTSGMLNFSDAFTEADIAGVWEAQVGIDYAQLHDVYEDSTWLKIDLFERIDPIKLENLKNKAQNCSVSAMNEGSVDFIETRHYFEFKANTYRYLADSKITYQSGDTTLCTLILGEGEFSIVGSYLYLPDLKTSLYVEIHSPEELYMGFAE